MLNERDSSILIFKKKNPKECSDMDRLFSTYVPSIDKIKDVKKEDIELSWEMDFIEFDEENSDRILYNPREKLKFLITRYLDHPNILKRIETFAIKEFLDIKSLMIRPPHNLKLLPFNISRAFDQFLKDENISWKEFVFNEKYVVVLNGNFTFEKIYEAGLFNKDNFESSYYDCNILR